MRAERALNQFIPGLWSSYGYLPTSKYNINTAVYITLITTRSSPPTWTVTWSRQQWSWRYIEQSCHFSWCLLPTLILTKMIYKKVRRRWIKTTDIKFWEWSRARSLAKELDEEDSIVIFIVIKGNILDHRRRIGTSGEKFSATEFLGVFWASSSVLFCCCCPMEWARVRGGVIHNSWITIRFKVSLLKCIMNHSENARN